MTRKAFLAILAHHHGFKGVYVQAAGLVFLFHLDGIPAFFQAEFAVLMFARHGAALVGSSRCDERTPQSGVPTNAAEGDDGGVR